MIRQSLYPVADEYLGKDEAQSAPRSGSRSSPCESFTQDRGDFTFGGHRLSSLYRDISLDQTGLKHRYAMNVTP
jgi:hypothetical protein